MARILIVDDAGFMRATIRLYVQDTEHECVGEAAYGEQALHLTKTLHPDVVLMDLSLSGIDGIETTRRIKAQSPSTEVIICSVSDSSDHVKAAFHAGATGYLVKPFTRDDLLRKLNAATK